jgi:N,N'-diacetyllegionaminate synthase
MKPIDAAGPEFGPGRPCFVVAEAGVNHNHDLELTKRLVDVAADAGADAVTFQTFEADRVVSATAPKAEYQLQTISPVESQLGMLQRLELSSEAYREPWGVLPEARRALHVDTV